MKGNAKEAVDSLKITASSAEIIMQTLHMRFGNPDQIVERIIRDIRKLPKFYSHKSDLISFATKIRNAIAGIQFLDHVRYLHSPELVQKILDKLPSTLVYEFNRFMNIRDPREPRFTALSEFLYTEAEMFSSTSTSRAVYAITEADERNPSCNYCSRRGHVITRCRDFLREPIRQRWRWARRENVCFKCFSKLFAHITACFMCHLKNVRIMLQSRISELSTRMDSSSKTSP